MKWPFRFTPPAQATPAEADIARMEALAELRRQPGFAALMDIFDAEVVAHFYEWVNTDPSKPDVLVDLHAKARATFRMIRLLEQTTTAKAQAEAIEVSRQEIERMTRAHKESVETRRAQVATAIAQRAQRREALLTGQS